MSQRTLYITAAIVLVVALTTAYFFFQEEFSTIGGDRDQHGCLVGGGYSFDEQVGACIRAFELTPDIKEAARLAVNHVGRGYALTVASFNSYEEVGSYDIIFERGLEREKQTIYIRKGKVQTSLP